MTTIDSTHADASPAMFGIRKIDTADLDQALIAGWQDFREKRGDIIFVGLLYPLVGLATGAIVLDSKLLPLFFPLVAGLSILGPAVATGFYELARRREEGEDASWLHFFDPLQGRSRTSIVALTLGLVALFLGWLLAAWAIYRVTLAPLAPEGADGFFHDLFHTSRGWTMILAGNAVGGLFASVTLVLTIVSFPLVVDKPVDPGTAILASIEAVRTNPGVVIRWGLRIALLLALGAIPAFIGLAVVLPVLGYATWHLYTRLVVR